MPITRDSTLEWMRGFAALMSEHRQELVRLDTAIGDGDHGTNMDRGMTAAIEKLDAADQPDAGTVLKTVAATLISKVGGAAGPLYGTLLLRLGTTLAGHDEVDLATWTAAWDEALAGVQARGKAQVGDKTMVDALVPAIAAMKAAPDLDSALRDAVAAAEQGMHDTIELEARRGRASYLGERSVGHQDPGATSTYYLYTSAAEALMG